MQRLEILMQYKPVQCYVGIDEFQGYFVFLFSHTNKVVLECPQYGNAIYIIDGNWKTLCRCSKHDLISDRAKRVTRIIHSGRWAKRLRAVLR